MAGNHKSRLEKLELRIDIECPPAPVYDFNRLEPGEGEIISQGADILERAERDYIDSGGIVPAISTRAYRSEFLKSLCDEELELLEQAATILERIQVIEPAG
jgi:hypothetical protein